MNIYIRYTDQVTASDSIQLNQLATTIERDCDTPVKLIKQSPQPGEKDAGLIIGLTIAGLVLTAIGTLVDVLSYWQSRQPQYSVTVNLGDKPYVLNNTSPNKLDDMIAEIEKDIRISEAEILIARK